MLNPVASIDALVNKTACCFHPQQWYHVNAKEGESAAPGLVPHAGYCLTMAPMWPWCLKDWPSGCGYSLQDELLADSKKQRYDMVRLRLCDRNGNTHEFEFAVNPGLGAAKVLQGSSTLY